MSVTITTNHHRRPTLDAWELTADERAEFDYLDWPAIEKGEDSRTFVRYRGDLIDMGDVLIAPESLKVMGWDRFNADTFFSGLAFRWRIIDGEEWVTVGRVYVGDD